jgi:hypothetical protein
MKNILYLGFFILKTDYKDLIKSINCTSKKGYNKLFLCMRMVINSLWYGSSFVDYYNFQFYRKNKEQKKEYATMGIMYKFHNKMNHKDFIDEVDNKKTFFKTFNKFCNPAFLYTQKDMDIITTVILERINQKIVIKNPESSGGKGVRIFQVQKKENSIMIGDEELITFLKNHFKENEYFYLEDFIVQHESIANISPSAVNTIRMITLLNDENKVDIIGSVFRISVDCPIDNYSAGNLAADIDSETGVVISGGIRKRSSCDSYHEIHPSTGQQILGLKVPFWNEIKQLVTEAAHIVPQVRTVGWDIAITPSGPIIIEGNSKWNKDTWQIPAGKGKLHVIKKYL